MLVGQVMKVQILNYGSQSSCGGLDEAEEIVGCLRFGCHFPLQNYRGKA
jgi:hypothetical protein